MSPPRQPGPARAGGLLLGVLGAGMALRGFLRGVLDLRDLPGAGGVQLLFRALSQRPDPPLPVWLHEQALLLLPDVHAAAGLISLISALALLLGAALLGAALGDRWSAIASAGAAGMWTLTLFPALVVGPDPPAMGLAGLGLGLAFAGARVGARGLPLVALGLGLGLAGVAVKAVALPALVLMGLGALLAPSWRSALGVLLLHGSALALGWRLISGAELGPAGAPIGLVALSQGFPALRALVERGLTEGVVHQVLLVGLLGAVLPGKGDQAGLVGRRALLGLLCAVAAVGVAGLLGDRLRPRYLLPVALPSLAFAGLLVRSVGSWLPRPLSPVPALVLMGLLGVDSWAWVKAWDRERAWLAEATPADLPAAPVAWAQRHQQLSLHALNDLQGAGAASLERIVAASSQGVALPTLRDNRYHQLFVSAFAHQRAAVVLDRSACCVEPDLSACATRVVAEVSAAGLVLALPVRTRMLSRVEDAPYHQALVVAAEAAGGLDPAPEGGERPATWWRLRAPQGGGGALPCAPPAVRGPRGPVLRIDQRVAGLSG